MLALLALRAPIDFVNGRRVGAPYKALDEELMVKVVTWRNEEI
jgi:hypothetical protein